MFLREIENLKIENPESILFLDDLKGRKEAQRLKLRFTGTLGVLVKAKKENHITDIATYCKALKDNGFRISDKIIELAIRQSNQ